MIVYLTTCRYSLHLLNIDRKLNSKLYRNKKTNLYKICIYRKNVHVMIISATKKCW